VHVQRVAMPASRVESWTVLGEDDAPIEPVEGYLAYLTCIERSPNTIKAYAHDLNGCSTLKWPHRSTLIWPHLGPGVGGVLL
jgi:hypothetical protein